VRREEAYLDFIRGRGERRLTWILSEGEERGSLPGFYPRVRREEAYLDFIGR